MTTATNSRPRLPAEVRNRPRPGAGICLSHVSDEQIVELIDAGLSRAEIAQHFGVADHVVRYRVRLLRKAELVQKEVIQYGKFFIDDYIENLSWQVFYMIPAHRRAEWNAFKRINLEIAPAVPAWAIPLSDLALVEFKTPADVGGYARAA